jgi:L-alanine-DL-glutamate epimerase-like enolase superfamily enzyme
VVSSLRFRTYGFARFRTDFDVAWFEDPVFSNDNAGLRLRRDQGPAGMEIAAGECAYNLDGPSEVATTRTSACHWES